MITFTLGFVIALALIYLGDGFWLRHIGYRFTDRYRIIRYHLKVVRLKRDGWHVQHIGSLGFAATKPGRIGGYVGNPPG